MTSARLAPALTIAALLCLAHARTARADWTFGVFLGGAHTEPSFLTLTQPSRSTNLTLSPVRYRSESLKPPFYYAYRAAFFPASGWFGVEGELVHLKVIADTARPARFDGVLQGDAVAGDRPLSSLVERFSISHGVNLLLINAVVRAGGAGGSAPPRWIVSGRFGAGASLPHPESTIGGLRREGYEWGSFSAQAAAGIEVRVWKRVHVSGEYKLTRTVQDVSVAGGSARTPLTTHHVAGGLVLHVGASRAAPRRRSAAHARSAAAP